MATSLSLDEQRTICKLYESGKSFKEIREITGRSREAQVKVLTSVGLYKVGLLGSANEADALQAFNILNRVAGTTDTYDDMGGSYAEIMEILNQIL